MSGLFSPMQEQALGLVRRGGLRRINILEGSVRSGKTWISAVMWGFWVASSTKEGAYLMAAGTSSSRCADYSESASPTA